VVADTTVIDTVLLAMSQAAPERIPAAHYGNISSMLLTGRDPANGRQFTSIEPIAGGWGARPHGDGPSAIYTIGHGDTFNVPIEVLETRFPVIVEHYRMRIDSGGAGRYRGGLGLERVYRIIGNGVFNGLSDRSYCPPWGLDGGKPGASGSISIRRKGRKAPKYFRKVTGLRLGAGDLLTFCTGGGGEYGDPLTREPERVAEDVKTGYVSAAQARDVYGVVFRRGTTNIDAARTDKLRSVYRAKARAKKPTRRR
jgi:N-methylhydantoinase B